VGVHPHDATQWDDTYFELFEEMLKNPKVVAVGEIGLDYFYDYSPKEVQIEVFKHQLDFAVKINKPAIIHNREATEDLMKIIREYKNKGLRAQFHCFSESVEVARELVEMRYYLSFTGNITYPKAENLRKVLQRIQIDDLLLETDAPFMTPVPFRGQRNEPAYIKYIAEKIAEVQNITVEDVARTTKYNTFKLFGIGNKPDLVYTYKIGNTLYINVTNRCNADCVFCDRKGEAVVSGYNLKMSKEQEPSAMQYINEIDDPKKYNEIVFCGYGEPTIRWDVIKEIAAYVKENGGVTRINTNGHGNVINNKDITPEMKGLIDCVSISLNSVKPEQYATLMRVSENMHKEMIDFALMAKKYTKVVMSCVGISEVDLQIAQKFVEEKVGVEFRTREFF